MLQRLLSISYFLLFFLTPLLWNSANFELFEYTKMNFVYLLTIIITTLWILKMVNNKAFIFKKTPLDLPLFLFLTANILSFIFSIDRHVSIWGYYSRSNGGLLSLISYLLLYYALVSNFSKEYVLKFIKAALFGGVVVALYAIPEHFGVSPSCLFIKGTATTSCWIQDVQARVFGTLGQPNWLAAYLGMLIFPAFYFFFTAKTKISLISYFLSLILFYLAFTFTYSRGSALGFLGAASVMMLLLIKNYRNLFPSFLSVLAAFAVINLLFGSALTDFKLLTNPSAVSRPAVTSAITRPSGTQLENEGTETGTIRLIVWQGALEIFKRYPLFGSGVETFAYSYYQFRPASHNLVSEWDFLYNKAHNEFLNYLATTGITGFISYLMTIIVFILWAISIIFNLKFEIFNQYLNNQKLNFQTKSNRIQNSKNLPPPTSHLHTHLLTLTLTSSYISYLIQNFFGFSVVTIALFFFLFPALLFIYNESVYPFNFRFSALNSILKKHRLYPIILSIIVISFSTLITLTLVRFYLADTFFASGQKAMGLGLAASSYNELSKAVLLNPGEPYYRSELSYAAASTAVSLFAKDATLSAQLKSQSSLEIEKILKDNPLNISFYRTAVRTYFMLSTLDKIYEDKTLEVLNKAISLAPTDPKLTYNKALILKQFNKDQEAKKALFETIRLRPVYKEALEKMEEWKAQN